MPGFEQHYNLTCLEKSHVQILSDAFRETARLDQPVEQQRL